MSAISETYNCDCYEYMRTLPDKYFDLCIADPPYGIAADARQQNRAGKQHGNAAAASRDYGTVQSWDLQAPAQEVFDEIFRVSRHQVIFGANHFISRMPYDASCWLVWDKDNGNNGYADCELDTRYYEMQQERFERECLNIISLNGKKIKQPTLFDI